MHVALVFLALNFQLVPRATFGPASVYFNNDIFREKTGAIGAYRTFARR
jgi:hypothetical protein